MLLRSVEPGSATVLMYYYKKNRRSSFTCSANILSWKIVAINESEWVLLCSDLYNAQMVNDEEQKTLGECVTKTEPNFFFWNIHTLGIESELKVENTLK